MSSTAIETQPLLQGNHQNRAVILNGKIVDYTNFVLRMNHFEGCDFQQVIKLKMGIGVLLRAMVEESSPEAFIVAKVMMHDECPCVRER